MRKTLTTAALMITAIGIARAEISIVSCAIVKAKPDTAFVTVYLSQSDVDMMKLNAKLDEKLAAFTNDISTVKSMKGYEVHRARLAQDEYRMYNGNPDMPKILKGVYAIQVEFEPQEEHIWAFVEYAIQHGASLFEQSHYSQKGLIVYGLRKYEDAVAEGFKEALAKAKTNASAMAKEGGLKLRGLIKVGNLASQDPCYKHFQYGTTYPIRFLGPDPNEIRFIITHEFTFETE